MSEIRMFDLGYPKADLGHGSVWATTESLTFLDIFEIFIYCSIMLL